MEQAASIIDRRDHIEKGLLAKFGEAFEKAAEQARAITDPALRALGAARIALEHAVLQTAVEKEMPPKEVTAMLEKASPQQVAHFIREGRKSVQRHYGIEPDSMVAALSAHVAEVDLPKGMMHTEAMRQLVDHGRSLVHQTVLEAYKNRGVFDVGGGDNLALRQSPYQTVVREHLKNHMIFVDSAINHAVRSGKMEVPQAEALKARVESQIFTTPRDTRMTEKFKEYYDRTGQDMRKEVMQEARAVSNDKTIREIAQRLHNARERTQSHQEPER